jgi:hypothetical protein
VLRRDGMAASACLPLSAGPALTFLPPKGGRHGAGSLDKCPGCIIRVCAAGLPGFPDIREWWSRSPCIHCGRPIIASRNRRPPKLFCCSTECDAAALNAAARRRRRSRRTERSCQGCGKPLELKRTDATFCSLACRQRAYRQRSP